MTDFCLRRPMLERILLHAKLMDRMMEGVSVDAAVAARLDRGSALYEARTRCIGCCNERQCRDWLARLEADDASNEPPEFCCNAEFFRALRPKPQGALASRPMEDHHESWATRNPHQAAG